MSAIPLKIRATSRWVCECGIGVENRHAREYAIMRDLSLFYFFPLSLTRTPNFL